MRINLGPTFATWLGFVAAFLAFASRATLASSRGQRHPIARWLDGRDAPAESANALLADDGLDDGTRRELAEAWANEGARAHEAIALASRRSLDLLNLGGLPGLVRSATEEAVDQVRAAKLSFDMARAIDAASTAPAPRSANGRRLPRRRALALARLAVDTLVDGAFAKGVDARTAAKLARRTTDPQIRAALEEIACMYAQHVVAAWAVIDWCRSHGGAAVDHALEATTRFIARAATRDVPQIAKDGGWERWGIAGDALVLQERGRTLVAMSRRLARAAPYTVALGPGASGPSLATSPSAS